ncbi:MAG TPA: protocatechuate 3,4-dioxygenase subunit alpha [Candidatus Binataceae bacterium]|nr:protocatechuate 3,4-dioxygenase subunit alpha [Candidatus Binataceae bacterium]
MSRPVTPSQTIGPFFHRALLHEGWSDPAARGAAGERVAIEGRVLDGDGAPVGDAMVEVWQANAAGRYDHPEDRQPEDLQARPLDPNFHGFGRIATDPNGRFRLRTIKPGPVPGVGDAQQAPHINVSIFARGLLKRLVTRIYFPGEPLNETDPLLSALPPARRATLIARAADRGGTERVLLFDIVLQGAGETVFLDV